MTASYAELLTTLGFHVDIPGSALASSGAVRLAEEPDALRSALRALTDKQRFVVTRLWGIHDGHEYSEREVAEAMGVRQRAVQTLHHRALEALRRGVVS